MSEIGMLRRRPVVRNNWEEDAGYETPATRSWVELVLGGFFIVRNPVPGFAFNYGDLAGFLLVVMSISRTPKFVEKTNRAYVVIFSLLIAFLVVESFYNDQNLWRRALRLSILATLAGCIASRRLDIVQLLKGFSIALLLNVPAYYLHLTTDNYLGCLTGFLWDKNVAGMVYATMSIMAMALMKNTIYRVATVLLGTGLTFLTLSRTSLVALAFGLIWIIVAKRAGIISRIVFAVIAAFAYVYLEDKFAHVGVFASRVGTDALRARIDDAMNAKVAGTPWYGRGLSTATVQVGPYHFFYHNSYLALITEGGWIFLLVVLLGFAVVTLRFFSAPPFTRTEIYLQAAGVVIMLCATRLGEVFMTLPTFVLMGASMQLMALEQHKKTLDPSYSRVKGRAKMLQDVAGTEISTQV